MKIAILGYGKEGQSSEKYFAKSGHDITIFQDFKVEELPASLNTDYDLILRSPSVPPRDGWSSMTQYFFDHCPCPIIGITGTKGKGTTCALTTDILKALGSKVWLVGNIGTPSLDVLDQIKSTDIVVYELSSFQLWDLHKSPHIAVVLKVEPDHLNIHYDYNDYLSAKSHITSAQTKDDFCIYLQSNADSTKIANLSPAQKLPYPDTQHSKELVAALNSLAIPGAHNRENAEAALLTVAAYFHQPLSTLLKNHQQKIHSALANFKSLPHRLELVRTLNQVKYYDDNFSTTLSSTAVALDAFKDSNIILIAGGRDKTANADLPKLAELFNTQTNLKNVILIGESGHTLYQDFYSPKFVLAESLKDAIDQARIKAEAIPNSIVLMSPAAASFDMFENIYDRGAQYQKLISEL